MRLGATIDDYLQTNDPDALVEECRRKGYRAAAMPLAILDQPEAVRNTARAFADADILLAEMAAWVNPLHHEAQQRSSNVAFIKEILALADEVGALCCPTVTGSYSEAKQWDSHVGHHPDNFSARAFEEVVAWVGEVLDQVRPTRTKLSLEICPWTLLDSPEIYLDLLAAIDRPGIGVHLDPANLVSSPRSFYDTAGTIDHAFDLLEPYLLSCHAKDVNFALDARTVGIEEVIPGRGVLDYATLLKRVQGIGRDFPVIIEHIETEANFDEAAAYIRRVGERAGVTF